MNTSADMPLVSVATVTAIQSRLTTRQQQILKEFMECVNEARVAKMLGLSPGTVRTHLREIMLRLHVRGRVELVKVVSEARSRDGDGSSSASRGATGNRESKPGGTEASD